MPSSVSLERPDVLGVGVHRARGEGDGGALGGEPLGDGLAEPPTAAGHECDQPFTLSRHELGYYADAGTAARPRRPAPPARADRRRRRRTARRRRVEPHLLGADWGSARRGQGGPTGASSGPQSRRAAPGTGDPGTAGHRGAGARRALGGRRRTARRPAAVRHVARRGRVAGAAVRPARRRSRTGRGGAHARRGTDARGIARPRPGFHRSGGEPVVGPQSEVDRWCRLLETVDPLLAPGWEGVATALRDREPAAMPAAVVHGDFRLGNLLADGAAHDLDHRLGDLDGGRPADRPWLVPRECRPDTYQRGTRYARALPSPVDLVDVYADALGRDLGDVEWFEALRVLQVGPRRGRSSSSTTAAAPTSTPTSRRWPRSSPTSSPASVLLA